MLADLHPGLHPSPELEEVVYRALAKDPADRWQSAGELIEAFASATAGRGALASLHWLHANPFSNTATAGRAPASGSRLARFFLMLPVIAAVLAGIVATML